MEQNDFSNSGRRPSMKYSCGIVLKSGHWSPRICRLKDYLFLALAAILFSKAKIFIAIYVEVHPRKFKHFYEIILKSSHLSRRREMSFKVFLLALAAILFSRLELFSQF